MNTSGDDRQRALGSTVAELCRKYGVGAVMRLGERPRTDVEVVPSGSRGLDLALGVGGYPRGRVVEIFGPESSGKTTLALHAVAEVQRAGGTAAFVDAEHALDVGWAERIGVAVDALLVSQPDTGEQALEVTESLVRSGAVDLLVVDSVAALVPQAELESDLGDSSAGLQARLMSQALRKLTAITARTGAVVLFVNQTRQRIGVVFGSRETTPGGSALKFYSSLRLDVRRVGTVTEQGTIVGARTRVKVVKNKLAAPFRTVEFEIHYDRGICVMGELLSIAEEAGVLLRSGSWFRMGEERIGQGKEMVRDRLLADPVLRARVELALDALVASTE